MGVRYRFSAALGRRRPLLLTAEWGFLTPELGLGLGAVLAPFFAPFFVAWPVVSIRCVPLTPWVALGDSQQNIELAKMSQRP